MKLREIGEKIDAHLKRIEADPELNPKVTIGRVTGPRFWKAVAFQSGNRIYLVYKGYQPGTTVTKAEALAYLEKLDAGEVGRHFELLREE